MGRFSLVEMPPLSSCFAALEAWLSVRPLRRAGLWFGLAVAFVYCGMPADELTFDNAFIIGDDTRLRIFSVESFGAILGNDYWWPSMASNLFRPLTTMSFWLEYSFLGYGREPLGYQAGNALLHWGNCVLLFALGRRLGLLKVWSFAAGVVYAIHPVATEVVANIVGRSDLFATAAVLGGLICYFWAIDAKSSMARLSRMFGMGMCGLCGVAAKESAVVLIALVGGHGLLRLTEWSRGGEERAKWIGDAWRAALCLAPCVVFTVATRIIFSLTDGVNDHPFIDNPLVVEPFLTSRLSALGVWCMQIGSLLAPLSLSNDYSFNAIPVASLPFGNTTAVLGWIAGLGFGLSFWLCWRAYRGSGSCALFLFAAYMVAMLPTSNLVIRIGSIRADRFHYMPTAFLWLLVALAIAAVSRRVAKARGSMGSLTRSWPVLVSLAAVWVLSLGVLAHFRCYDWRSNLSLWTSAFKTHPESAKVLSAAGNVRVITQQNVENEKAAIFGHLKALELFRARGVPLYNWPLQTYSDLLACYLNLHDAYALRGEHAKADEMLESAFAVYHESRKVDKAAAARWKERFGSVTRTTVRMVDVLSRNYALALSRRGRHAEAFEILDEVIKLLPLKIQNRQTYVDLLMAAGKNREALGELLLIRIMEPAIVGDLAKVAIAARMVDPNSKPLIKNEKSEDRLNLGDPLINEITREQLQRYRDILRACELPLDVARLDRVAKYYYGYRDWR